MPSGSVPPAARKCCGRKRGIGKVGESNGVNGEMISDAISIGTLWIYSPLRVSNALIDFPTVSHPHFQTANVHAHALAGIQVDHVDGRVVMEGIYVKSK